MAARVVLAMSGGVDSSVAAYLLKAQGYEVIGIFMRTGAHGSDADAEANAERRTKTCCSVTDAVDARRVADRLDIPFYVLDFERDFSRIMDQFAEDYLQGRTPNPCVMCNIWLKFGKLWAYGKQAGADFVATGHYARMLPGPDGTPRIARAVDNTKDQSYVLFGLRRELLAKVLLPVGGYAKSEIRELARLHNLPVHDKPDSQEICFIPDDNYVGFVKARRPDSGVAGAIVDDADGRVLAKHEGIEGFTIGQRRGLGFAAGSPRYVIQIDPVGHTVRVGGREQLLRPGLTAHDLNWHGTPPLPGVMTPCRAQIRAQHRAVPAHVVVLPDQAVQVWFETPQSAVTPGQAVTLYDPDNLFVIGGGWIANGLDESARKLENSAQPANLSQVAAADVVMDAGRAPGP